MLLSDPDVSRPRLIRDARFLEPLAGGRPRYFRRFASPRRPLGAGPTIFVQSGPGGYSKADSRFCLVLNWTARFDVNVVLVRS